MMMELDYSDLPDVNQKQSSPVLDFSDLPDDKTAQKQSFVDAQLTTKAITPQQAVQAKQASSQFNIPFLNAVQNPDIVADRKIVEGNTYDDLAARAPKTATFLQDPVNAAIAKDDHESLAKVEGFWATLKALPNAIAEGAKGAYWQDENKIYFDKFVNPFRKEIVKKPAFLGEHPTHAILNTTQELQLQKSEKGMTRYGEATNRLKDNTALDFAQYTGYGIGQLAIMGKNIINSPVNNAAAGAGVALAGATMAASSAFPEIAPLAKAAQVAQKAFKYGAIAFVGADSFKQNANEAHKLYVGLKDENGKPLPKNIVQTAALATGGINALLDVTSVVALEAMFAPAVRNALKAMGKEKVKAKVADMLARESTRKLIMKWGATAGGVAIGEGAIEGAQDLIKNMGREIAQDYATENRGNAEFKSPTLTEPLRGKDGEIVEPSYGSSAWDNAKMGFKATLAMGMTGAGINTHAQISLHRDIAAFKNERTNLDLMNQAVTESPSMSLDPTLRTRLMQHLGLDGDAQELYMDANKTRDLFQSFEGVTDPVEEVRKMFGDETAKNFAEALNTSSDFAVPADAFVTEVMGTKLYDSVKDFTRVNPQSLTQEDIANFEAKQQEYAKQFAETERNIKENGMTDPVKRVYDDVYGQVKGLSDKWLSDKDMQDYALIHAIHAATRSSNLFNGDYSQAWNLYEPYQLSIKNEAKRVSDLKQGKFNNDIDPLLNEMRAGTTKAKQQAIYGKSLMASLRAKGLTDVGGELAARDVDKSLKPFQRKLIRADGIDLDAAASWAAENGYIKNPDINELLDAIDSELFDNPVYSDHVQNSDLADRENKIAHIQSIFDKMGIDIHSKTNDELRDILTGDNTLFQEEKKQIDAVRTQYEGTDQWMKAPNGKPTKLNEMQWLQVRTPNFKAWFGDWENDPKNASKVIDENGEPLVVYHGGNKNIRVFNTGGMGDSAGAGVFLTDNKEIAAQYAGQYAEGKYAEGMDVYPVFLNIRKIATKDWDLNRWDAGTNEEVEYDEDGEAIGDTNLTTDDFSRDARSKGYDGTNMYRVSDDLDGGGFDSYSDVYTVYSPEQIKSATGNTGEFSSSNPNILYQSGIDVSQDFTVPSEGMTVLHGTDNKNLTIDDINIVRTGQKQAKKGRSYGGFYTTFEENESQAQRYSTDNGNREGVVYSVKIKPDTKVKALPSDITRLSDTDIAQWVGEGFGAITGRDGRGRQEFVVIDKGAIESIDKQDGNKLYHSDNWYFSPLRRAVEGIKQEVAPSSQWIATIAKQAGVKADELSSTGLNEWLELQQGKITKAQILDYLKGNSVEVRDVVVGEKYGFSFDGEDYSFSTMEEAQSALDEKEQWIDEEAVVIDADEDNGTIKVTRVYESGHEIDTLILKEDSDGQWRFTHGGYDERSFDDYDEAFEYAEEHADDSKRDISRELPSEPESLSETKFFDFTEEGGENYKEMTVNLIGDEKYKVASGHSINKEADTNQLVRIRFDERTDQDGNKTMFLEEIQSDLGQEGKKKGFGKQEQYSVVKYGETYAKFKTQEEAEDYVAKSDVKNLLISIGKWDGLPALPLVQKTDTWVALAIKRAIRYASENGFDRIAWTTGRQQGERYDLRTQVSQVTSQKRKDGSGYTISAISTNGRPAIRPQLVTESELAETLGKDLAEKIINSKTVAGDFDTWEGMDLAIGGEGMTAFYDNIVPKVANEIIKKLGGNKVNITTFDDIGAQQGFDITESMRDMAMTGQALFQSAKGYLTIKPNREMDITMTGNANFSTFLHESGHLWLEMMRDDLQHPNATEAMKADWKILTGWFGDYSVTALKEIQGDVKGIERKIKTLSAKAKLSDAQQKELAELQYHLESHNQALDYIESNADKLKDVALDFGASIASERVRNVLTKPFHEQFARGMESYFRDGKAPSIALESTFANFANWLQNVIYKTMQMLGVNLTDDVRGVMDRMFATDAEIKQAKEIQNIEPIFGRKIPTEMTEADKIKYVRLLAESEADSKRKLLAEVLKSKRQAEEEKYQLRLAEIRKEIEQQLNVQPSQIAMYFLRTGQFREGAEPLYPVEPVKLDRAALVDTFGESYLKDLPKGSYTAKGGIHYDELAEALGFESGRKMLQDIINDPLKTETKRNQYLDEQADYRMRDENPELITQQAMTEEAQKAIHSDKRAQVLINEIENLSKLSGKKATTAEMLKAYADKMISYKAVQDIHPAIYQRAEAAANRKTIAHVAKEEYAEALESHQTALLNHYLFSKALESQADYKKRLDHIKRYLKTSVRKNIAAGGAESYLVIVNDSPLATKFTSKAEAQKQADIIPDSYVTTNNTYLEMIDSVLGEYDIKKMPAWAIKFSDVMNDLVSELQEMGEPVPELASLPAKKNIHRLSYADFVQVDNLLTIIERISTGSKQLNTIRGRMDLADIIGEMRQSSAGVTSKKIKMSRHKHALDKLIDAKNAYVEYQTRIDVYNSILDGEQEQGIFHDMFLVPSRNAHVKKEEMKTEMELRLKEIFTPVYEEFSKSHILGGWNPKNILKRDIDAFMGHSIYIESLDSYESVQTIMGWAQLYGHQGGRDALLHPDNIHQLTEEGILEAIGKLTSIQLDAVEKIVKLNNSYWSRLEALDKRTKGYAAPKVEPLPYMVGDRMMSGGYSRLAYDGKDSIKVRFQDMADGLKNVFSQSNNKTNAGSTNKRTGSGGKPPRYDFSLIHENLVEVIHDLTHREFVMNAQKIIKDKGFQDLVSQKINPEAAHQYQLWINNRGVPDKLPTHGFERFLGFANNSSTIMLIGMNTFNFLQNSTGIAVGTVLVGEKYMLMSTAKLASSPVAIYEFVDNLSSFMRGRAKSFGSRDAARTLQADSSFTGKNKWVAEAAFIGQRLVQGVVDKLVWYGAYQKAMDGNVEGIDVLDQVRAIQYADRVIEQTQGGAGGYSQANVYEKNEFVRLFTLLGGYMNQMYALSRIVHNKGRYKPIPKRVFSEMMAAFYIMILPTLITAWMRAGKDDDDSWWEWAEKNKVIGQLVSYPASFFILARPLVSNLLNPTFDFKFSPSEGAFQALADGMRSGVKMVDALFSDEEDAPEIKRRDVKNVVNAGGYLLHLPTRGMIKSGEPLYDYLNGDYTPEDNLELTRAILLGKPK